MGIAAHLLNALAPLVEALEPAKYLSPIYYYIEADPLSNGLDLTQVGVLTAVTIALLIVAIVTFERRDLAV